MSVIILYLIGCILSFFRIYASFRELSDELYLESDKSLWVIIFIISAFSWFGFLTGIFIYIKENEKRFF